MTTPVETTTVPPAADAGPPAPPANRTRPTVDITTLPAPVRWRRALRALAAVLRDPDKTDQVLVFSTYANAGSSTYRVLAFFEDPRGRALYEAHRTLDSHTVDLDALAKLPEGTLGHAYATFMKLHGLTPDVFDGTPTEVGDPRLAYVMQRIRQTHDLWHVVTNAQTDPAGEVALQAFTFAQLHAPSSGILAAVGTLRGMRYTRDIVRDVVGMYRLGKRANSLALFPWEDHWTTPLVEVRRLLGLPMDPDPIGGYSSEVPAAA